MAGCRIWRCTMPSNVSWPKPSTRARWNASSRFGPTTPVVLARASTWRGPHLATNCCLPFTTLAPWLVSEQPLRTAAVAITATSAMVVLTLMERGILTAGPDVRRWAGQAVQLALRGGDHGARHPLPRGVLAGGGGRRPGPRPGQSRGGGRGCRRASCAPAPAPAGATPTGLGPVRGRFRGRP